MLKISQYPQNADGTPMDFEVGVLTDNTGNNGARMPAAPVGPDNAPIPVKAVVLVDIGGNLVPVLPDAMPISLFSTANTKTVPTVTTSVVTSGYSTQGVGGAKYVYDATLDATYVAAHPRTSFISANNRVFRMVELFPDIMQFGAKGDTLLDGAGNVVSGTDDSDAVQTAFDYVGAMTGLFPSGAGAILTAPGGNFKVTRHLNYPTSVTFKGRGRKSTRIIATHGAVGGGANAAENARNDSVFVNWQPINVPTRIDITIEDVWIHSANPANIGAAFYNQTGMVITLRNSGFTGAKWAVLLDQSINVLIDNCELSSGIVSGACLFVCNGPDFNPTAAGMFTNTIEMRGGSINPVIGAYGVVDNGGYAHTYHAVNFNGGVMALRASAVLGLSIINPYAESQGSEIFHFDSTKLNGAAVGGCNAIISGGELIPTVGNPAIRGANGPGSLTVIGGSYAGGTPNPLVGAANFNVLNIITPGYAGYPGGAEFCDGSAGGAHFESAKLTMTRAGNLSIPGAFTSGGAASAVGALSVTGASGTARFINFQTGGATAAYWALGGDNVTLFGSVPAGGSYNFQVNGVQCAIVSATGLSLPALTLSYQINGVQVIGARKTGWSADTGTAKRTANATYTPGAGLTYSAAYVQAEQTAMATRMAAVEAALRDAMQTIKALKDDFIQHGAIGA